VFPNVGKKHAEKEGSPSARGERLSGPQSKSREELWKRMGPERGFVLSLEKRRRPDRGG